MQIEIKTTAYANNANYNAISGALTDAGHKYHLQGRCYNGGDWTGVLITTDAPQIVLDGVSYTASAVTIRA